MMMLSSWFFYQYVGGEPWNKNHRNTAQKLLKLRSSIKSTLKTPKKVSKPFLDTKNTLLTLAHIFLIFFFNVDYFKIGLRISNLLRI